MASPRVDFYVLASADPALRLRFACRLVEKAYLRDHRVRVRLDPGDEVGTFDSLLWTFADRSFVPHERLGADGSTPAPPLAPVAIVDSGTPAPEQGDVLVNLAADVPAEYERYLRIVEIVDADGARRRLGRERFRFYREHGIQPETHGMGSES
jgi:DNA polymerase-3 subunit chi